MNKNAQAPFANLVAELCSNSQSDVIKKNIGSSLAVPEKIRSLCVAIASQNFDSTLLVITPTNTQAQSLAYDLENFLDKDVIEYFPAWETLPFERVSPSIEAMGHRCRVISKLHSNKKPKVVVASARAAAQKIIKNDITGFPITKNEELDRDYLINTLVTWGYSREFQVESRGEFSVRGSILDIFPSTTAHPIRIEFWGDTVERISEFSIADQRSKTTIENLEIFPARELIVDDELINKANELAISFTWASQSLEAISNREIFDGMESFLPILSADQNGIFSCVSGDDQIILCDPTQINHRLNDLIQEESALAQTLSVTWDANVKDTPSLFINLEKIVSDINCTKTHWPSIATGVNIESVLSMGFDSPRGDIVELTKRLRKQVDDGFTTILVSDSSSGVKRICDQLSKEGLNVTVIDEYPSVGNLQGIYALVATLEHGFVSSTFSVSIITDHELAGRRHVRRSSLGSRKSIQTYDDLTKGDYVVHHHHGVGVFEGLETKTMMGVTREYLILSFKGSDKLFVPSDQVGLVRKYIGTDKPVLNKLGGADFEKTKNSIRSQVNLIAQELIVLYRKRLNTKGHAFSPDNNWQKEMEDLFPYELTIDQARAINEVKQDMENDYPMDRLVCGDVGFGKTEVALRAAFKAVQDSKQVAVLVPTTLLATQHGHTFESRLTSFGLNVQVLSRFKTAKEQRQILDDLKTGAVDVVIGTHRLLSKDVSFKNLGLLIVDEEQRFGVSHKEALKHFTINVDVLTLSATPIPRTLEMSLTGIRDMSMITTPPAERQPILTYVHEYDERAVAEAIRRELLREGQVFFVHNRVRDLEHIADRVRDLVPEAKVITAHGQMSETKLERIVEDFYEKKYDVLIATTIIESGLDLPSVNTLIVDRADAMGLAQLYQLRGRVGRRGQRAYAYLFSPQNKAISHEAYERLKTIGEFTELGSGFKIAMRDLEMRGAGSLLGDVQSGHIAAVGFDLYCEMVTNAIDELNGVEPEQINEVTIDLPLDALLPEDYVSKQDQRFDIYRRLTTAKTVAEIDQISEELLDRFGPLPKVVENLIGISNLRTYCISNSITSIISSSNSYRLLCSDLAQSLQIRLKRLYPYAIYKPRHALGPAEIVLKIDSEDIIFQLQKLITDLFGESELA
ncbi:MAG: transcription-repair coupling factor [Acidimicrobiia bacterium]